VRETPSRSQKKTKFTNKQTNKQRNINKCTSWFHVLYSYLIVVLLSATLVRILFFICIFYAHLHSFLRFPNNLLSPSDVVDHTGNCLYLIQQRLKFSFLPLYLVGFYFLFVLCLMLTFTHFLGFRTIFYRPPTSSATLVIACIWYSNDWSSRLYLI